MIDVFIYSLRIYTFWFIYKCYKQQFAIHNFIKLTKKLNFV